MDTDETTRETETTEEIEKTKEEIIESLPPMSTEYNSPELYKPYIDAHVILPVDLNRILSEAPELYGTTPTAQEIEDFKQKEITWRLKLKSL